MDNQPSFVRRTKQLKEIALQLKNAAEIVLDRAELIGLTGYKTAPTTAGAVFCAYKKG
jgi:hypothetical protein